MKIWQSILKTLARDLPRNPDAMIAKKPAHYIKWITWSIAICAVLALGVVAVISYKNRISPSGIIIHHSALPYAELPSDTYVSVIDEIHRKRGYGAFYWGRTYYIGYHFVILPDGSTESGRPEHLQGAHTFGYNSYIGICVIGDFSSLHNPTGEFGQQKPNEAQMQSLFKLCRQLIERYKLSSLTVLRHKDVNPDTECPGDRFPFQDFLAQLQRRE